MVEISKGARHRALSLSIPSEFDPHAPSACPAVLKPIVNSPHSIEHVSTLYPRPLYVYVGQCTAHLRFTVNEKVNFNYGT